MNRNPTQRKLTGHAPVVLLACAGCVATALLFIRCASLEPIAGTGSQAGNGRIACVVHNTDGSPASCAAVFLCAAGAMCDTLTNLETGEVLRGYVTGKKDSGLTVVNAAGRGPVGLNLAEWRVEIDRSGASRMHWTKVCTSRFRHRSA